MGKIIILETVGRAVRYALWADVPAARQKFYANAAFTSVFLDVQPADLASLRSGALVERVEQREVDGTLAQMRSHLETRLAAFQAEVTARNDWSRYGSSFDGTIWTAVTVS